MQLQDELAQLKSELALLRNQQVETQENYLQRLDDFSFKLDTLSQSTQHPLTKEVNGIATQTKNKVTIDDSEEQVEKTQQSHEKNPILIASDETTNKPKISTNEKVHLSVSNELTSGLIEQFSEFALAPFTPLISKLRSFYSHYQQRGLAAVFLMTVAGIITMTLGFTYLLQYSFNNWLSEIGKVSFAFICANILLALGVYLYKRRAQMQDFASGIIGLGFIVNYISAYFSGPYFHLVPDWFSLLLLLLISLIGFFLSFKFETKVVAVLSLIGGSLAPIMLFNEAT